MRSVAHLVDGIRLQHLVTAHVVAADAAADLDDDSVLLAVGNLELFTGRYVGHGRPLCVRMGLLSAALAPGWSTSHGDRPYGKSDHGAQDGGSKGSGPLSPEHPMVHDRLTGSQVFGLAFDQRAFDGNGYGAQPGPVAGVVGDLLIRGPGPTPTEQGRAQLRQPLNRRFPARAGADLRARVGGGVHDQDSRTDRCEYATVALML